MKVFLGAQTVGGLGAGLDFWSRDGKFCRFLTGGGLEGTTGILGVAAGLGGTGYRCLRLGSEYGTVPVAGDVVTAIVGACGDKLFSFWVAASELHGVYHI